ncbi:MAG: SBBP repeat-containing protein [Crocinitomicaceae bacterium]
MKIQYLLALFILLTSANLLAQTLDFEWANQYGGMDIDNGRAIHTDTDGHVYVVGNFEGTADFDAGVGVNNLTSFGSNDVFVIKLESNGDLIWARQIAKGTPDAFGTSVGTDDNGNVYTTGVFYGTAEFDPLGATASLTSNGGSDVFTHKMNANGELVWVKQFGGLENDSGSSTIEANGNVMTTGQYFGTADFDPGSSSLNLTASGESDIYFQKLDTDGNLIWAKSIGGIGYDSGSSVLTDISGNYYSIGSFSETVDFDSGAGVSELISNGIGDIFILKLDANGDFTWVKQIGGISLEIPGAIQLDDNSDVYVTGSFFDTVDFDPGPGVINVASIGNMNTFILKIDQNGDYIWSKQFGGVDNVNAVDLEVTSEGFLLVSGNFQGTIDFNPNVGIDNLTAIGQRDIFLQILNSNGEYIWTETIEGAGWDLLGDMSIDENGNIYSTGSFAVTADFDPSTNVSNLSSFGSYDMFVQKLNDTPLDLSNLEGKRGFTVYPNPTKGQFFVFNDSNSANVQIRVFDAVGTEVYRSSSIDASGIELSSPSGLYLVEISSDLGVQRFSLVKN